MDYQDTGMGPVATSMGGGSAFPVQDVPEGTFTTTVYKLIAADKFEGAFKILYLQWQQFPRSRAALSLLGYCSYMMEDYLTASTMYERLVKLYPQVPEYRLHYAQALYLSGNFPEATKAALSIEDRQFYQRVRFLRLRGCLITIDTLLTRIASPFLSILTRPCESN
jgi:tetratricopeptide repeat protein 30